MRTIKAVQRGYHACRCDLENRASVVVTSLRGCSVEISVCALRQTSKRVGTVGAVNLRTEAVDCGQGAGLADFEDGATTVGIPSARPARTTRDGCPVQVSINALDKRCVGISPVSSIEIQQSGQVWSS